MIILNKHVDANNIFERSKSSYKFLILLAMLNAVTLATSTVLGYKQVIFAGIIEYGTTILFPATYFFQDVITEVYGYKISRQIIWGAMFCALVSASMLVLVVHLPAESSWKYQKDFDTVLDPMLRVAIASTIGTLFSSFINIYLLAKWKILVKGKYFWIRSLTSTAIGELILTVVSVLIGFIGRADFHSILNIILYAFLFKVFFSFIGIYPEVILVRFLKKSEGLDTFDYGTNFNPFKFDLS